MVARFSAVLLDQAKSNITGAHRQHLRVLLIAIGEVTLSLSNYKFQKRLTSRVITFL